MAYTSIRTITRTKAFTRIQLIKTQVRIAIRRTTDISPEVLKNTFDKGIDYHWIKSITIYGIDSEKYCRAQLTLEIDWNEYDVQLARGKATVAIDGRWEQDTAIELDEVITLFNKYVTEYSLITRTQFMYVDEVDSDMANQELEAVVPELIQWERGWSSKIPELPELRVGCYFAGE